MREVHEALLAYFRALSLDPEFGSAVKNALAALANWSVELSQAKKWEDALEVVTTEWGKSAFGQAGVTGVAQAARAVAARFPGMPDLNETAANQVNNAVIKQVDSGEFAAALLFLDEARPLFRQDKLRSLQEYAYDHWAKRRMAAKDWSGGGGCLCEGYCGRGRKRSSERQYPLSRAGMGQERIRGGRRHRSGAGGTRGRGKISRHAGTE